MILLVILFLLCGTEPALAQRIKVADAVGVTKTKDTHTVVWRATEDGTLTTSGLTAAEYAALGEVNAAPPSQHNLPANRTWEFVSASKKNEYSTPSGTLEPGNIYVTEEHIFVILTSDENYLTLEKKDYTVTDTGGKTLKIEPDPPGVEIKDGEVHKK